MLLSSMLKISVPALLLGVVMSSWASPMQGWFRHRGRFRQDADQSAGRGGPVTLPNGARLVRNVAYGSDSKQTLDVYIPQNASNAPIIFMVHGGGWTRGDKTASNVVQNKIDYFLPKGYVFVSVDYRMVPDVSVMTEADDVAHALAYVQQHAADWGGDASKVVVMGHSAGAHLVTLISSVPAIWQDAGAKPWLGTISLDSAAYNVVTIMDTRHFPLYDPVFGNDQQLWQQASPTLRLQGAPTVPMLLVCSSLRANSCSQADGFADRAQSFGGHVKVYPVALRHAQINANVGLPGDYTDEIESFINSLGIN
jgi:arylformamidase